MLPTLAAFVIGFVIPFVEGLYLSFCKFTTINKATWVGFGNYQSFSSFAGNHYLIDLDMLIGEQLLLQEEVDAVNWGNPLYNWDKMKETGFAWWIRRLTAAAKMYDVVRLDHFRGFESYWSVPAGDKTAAGGEWKQGPGAEYIHAIQKHLPNLEFIAEDLGLNKEEGLVRGMIRGAMSSVSRLCVIQMQDYLELGGYARMNFPGTLSPENWTWRAPKDFITESLTKQIYSMTQRYGRL